MFCEYPNARRHPKDARCAEDRLRGSHNKMMSKTECSKDDCDDLVFALGLCLPHYKVEARTYPGAQKRQMICETYDAAYDAAYDVAFASMFTLAEIEDLATLASRSACGMFSHLRIPKDSTKEHGVYRHYAEGDILLYVGYTSRLNRRNSEHAASESWWREVADTTWESFDSRDEAIHAELKAIQTEHPLWNIKGRPRR